MPEQAVHNRTDAAETPSRISPESTRARVIAVASGKGGVGKTNIAVNLGIALIQLGHRVLIVDADLGMANVDLLLGLNPKYSVKHILSGKREISDVLLMGPLGIRALPAGSGGRKADDPSPLALRDLLKKLSQQTDIADLIIVDMGAEISDNAIEILCAADEVLLVTTPEPTSIMDAHGLLRSLSRSAETHRVRVLVNMAEDQYDAQHVMATLQRITKQFSNLAIDDIGWINNDINVARAVRRLQPFALLYPNAKATRSVQQAAMRLTGHPKAAARPEGGLRGLYNRFAARYM